MGYQSKRFSCDNGQGEYDIMTFIYILAIRSTIYDAHPPYGYHITVLPNVWSVQSPKRHRPFWLTPKLQFSSVEKQLIVPCIMIRDHIMNVWTELTAMSMKQHTKYHWRCCVELYTISMMPTVTRFGIMLPSILKANSNVVSADLSPNINAKPYNVWDQNPTHIIHISTCTVSFSILIGQKSVAEWLSGWSDMYKPQELKLRTTHQFKSGSYTLTTKCDIYEMYITLPVFTSQVDIHDIFNIGQVVVV
jgi:hypothetical protein